MLVAGAVAGPEFDAALVAEAVGLPALATLDVLDAAVGARLLVEDSGRFGFVHALVRDALTEPLTAARRARIHELLAEALESALRTPIATSANSPATPWRQRTAGATPTAQPTSPSARPRAPARSLPTTTPPN